MKVLILMLMVCLASTVDASPNNKARKVKKVRNLLKKRFDLDDTIIIPTYWDYDFSKLAGDSNDVYKNSDYINSNATPSRT
jgi:hypothetical protein